MAILRNLLLWASRNQWLKERVPRYRFARRAVRRFMPGEDVETALVAAAQLDGRGMATVLTHLGENIADAGEAEAVTAHYLDVLDRVAERGLDCEISVKPTQLGLDLDPELAARNLLRLAERAEALDNFVWIDMESSDYVDATLELYRRARARHPVVGVCLQAYLYRTRDDLDALLPLPPAIRLVKGAYAEPKDRAFPKKRDVDENYARLGGALLTDLARGTSVRVGFATHDTALVQRLEREADRLGLPKHAFEVQMLYGIRRQEQARLTREGYRVRVLISYGKAWYPWYVRRLAERPANLWFVLRSMLSG